ncbi:hypothetical protein GCM10017673_54850 [Streptosporangium violaceochromogenes]|nr:hypothetical protein GCM10017673_54850 [Streptosporangium violaceochromogenes]
MGAERRVLGVISLAGTRESVSRARAEVRHWLGDDHPAVDDVALAVSELVTNAVVHSGVRTEDALHLTLTGRASSASRSPTRGRRLLRLVFGESRARRAAGGC